MIAQVTGLWDLSRSELQDQWKRPFAQQLEQLNKLLQLDANFQVFGPPELESFVFDSCNRKRSNTFFIERPIEWFRSHESQSAIQAIRTNPKWYNSVGWLAQSTQASLELQNPVVMTKFDMLAEAAQLGKFSEKQLFWIDGGIANTVSPHFIKIHKDSSELPNFFFIAFPYNASTEIHGFDAKQLYKFAGCTSQKVARGGFFGGTPDLIAKQFDEQNGLRRETLDLGLMGTEESLLTIQMYRHKIAHGLVEGNGLIYKFFLEKPVWVHYEPLPAQQVIPSSQTIQPDTALQILTYESPRQLKALLESFSQDPTLLQCKLYLFQNSSQESLHQAAYQDLINQQKLEVLGNGTNQGIVRARVEIAKHFHASPHSYQIFFEDDMLFSKSTGFCISGFPRRVPNVLKTLREILVAENLDQIKMNQSEFFGTHRDQWAWHNVPQSYRDKHWPNTKEKPPIAVSKVGKLNHHSVSYLIGEVFLCNWPILFTKRGNEICQIETTFAHPQEQTLMSQAQQIMATGRLRAGVLLASPTEHQRFDFQDAKSRKEN